jgi:hypothetical protein
MTDATNQAADDAETPQPTDETADEQQQPAPETNEEADNCEDATNQGDSAPRGVQGLCQQVEAAAFALRTAGKPADLWALHKLGTLLGSLKSGIPDAVTALGEDSDLAAQLQSLLVVL